VVKLIDKSMKILVKRAPVIILFFFVLSMAMASCKAHRSSCPAYGGESGRYKIERIYTR
jgi:hypothetical protein